MKSSRLGKYFYVATMGMVLSLVAVWLFVCILDFISWLLAIG